MQYFHLFSNSNRVSLHGEILSICPTQEGQTLGSATEGKTKIWKKLRGKSEVPLWGLWPQEWDSKCQPLHNTAQFLCVRLCMQACCTHMFLKRWDETPQRVRNNFKDWYFDFFCLILYKKYIYITTLTNFTIYLMNCLTQESLRSYRVWDANIRACINGA